jgi:hypothetical protein
MPARILKYSKSSLLAGVLKLAASMAGSSFSDGGVVGGVG